MKYYFKNAYMIEGVKIATGKAPFVPLIFKDKTKAKDMALDYIYDMPWEDGCVSEEQREQSRKTAENTARRFVENFAKGFDFMVDGIISVEFVMIDDDFETDENGAIELKRDKIMVYEIDDLPF